MCQNISKVSLNLRLTDLSTSLSAFRVLLSSNKYSISGWLPFCFPTVNKMMKQLTFEHMAAVSIINNDGRNPMCLSWKRVDIVSATPSALTSQYVLLIWFSEHREAYFLFLTWLFITHLLCLYPFQRNAVAPSRKSPRDVSCLRATLRHMSTTCTAFGPSRRPPEAPSGLSGALHFGALLDFWLHCSFPGVLSIRKLSIHFQFSLAFFFLFFFLCSGIHHFYKLLCNQSLLRPLLANRWVAIGWEEIPL